MIASLRWPLEEISDRLPELDDDLEKTIVLVCTTDRRSLKAAKILTRHGFADIHVVKGGMTDCPEQAGISSRIALV